jgi:iron complex outermembrane receptor protein
MKKLTTLFFLFLSHVLFGQKVEGIIFDQETNAPLWGASVRVQGSQRGVLSDAKGHFSVTDIQNAATLHISFVGYQPQDIPVAAASRIGLVRSSYLQDEVVVQATRADETDAKGVRRPQRQCVHRGHALTLPVQV